MKKIGEEMLPPQQQCIFHHFQQMNLSLKKLGV